MQYLALSTGLSGVFIVFLNGLGNLLHLRTLNRASILVVFVAYLFMAWALAHRRIFNARQVLMSVGQRFAVAGLVALATWALAIPLSQLVSTVPAWIGSAFVCCSGAFWLDQRTRDWLDLGGTRALTFFRAEIMELARRNLGAAQLADGFEGLLASHHDAKEAIILDRHGDKYLGHDLEIAARQEGFILLCEEGWTTPESLQRRRQTAQSSDLAEFLEAYSLGVLVTAPNASLSPSLVVALGIKNNEAPYTYPEVQRLQNVAELIDNILTHARLTDQVALRARLEHMGMISRGLAHDLKNLVTPIAEFLAHVDGRFPPGTPEAEVHGEARRSAAIISDYLKETLFFATKLEPLYSTIDFNRLFEGVRAAVTPRLSRRSIRLELARGNSCRLIADQALVQRLLANLVANAVDASDPGSTVRLTVSGDPLDWVHFAVVDQGAGMVPETIDRIFDPFFTTKGRDNDLPGFGLGLTIAKQIVELHAGRIAVTSAVGVGTEFTVAIPALPRRPNPITTPA